MSAVAGNITECLLLPGPLDQFLCLQRVAQGDPLLGNLSSCVSGGIPFPLTNEGSCAQGIYCPNIDVNDTATWPVACPPTPECQFLRLQNQWCAPQGKYEPSICAPGTYCPTPAVQVECPEGHWCIRGSVAPRACALATYCPAGTQVGRFYGGVLACLILDVLLLAYWLQRRYVGEPRAARLGAVRRKQDLLLAVRVGGAGGAGAHVPRLFLPTPLLAAAVEAAEAADAAEASSEESGAAPAGLDVASSDDPTPLPPPLRGGERGRDRPFGPSSTAPPHERPPLPFYRAWLSDAREVARGVSLSAHATFARVFYRLPAGVDTVVDFGASGPKLRVRTRSMRRASGAGPLFAGLVDSPGAGVGDAGDGVPAGFYPPPPPTALRAAAAAPTVAGRRERVSRMSGRGAESAGGGDFLHTVNPARGGGGGGADESLSAWASRARGWSGGGEEVGGGDAASPAPLREADVVAAATALLADAFRRCNHGLTLDLSFESLGLTLPPPISKTILSGVTGAIRPGRVTAIMGPSGAGKTTFLNVLMGLTPRTQGTLQINGRAAEMTAYRSVTGFVPQEDVMLRELTVRENVMHAARVRLPRTGWSHADVTRHVDSVIHVLGLAGCADTLSCNVSGGQRKRVNIGMELAAAPAALFLDEPTSGLDSTAALEVCSTLKAIALLGLTVVAVVHQPRGEIFSSFDDLLLLAPGGRTVYLGPQAGAAQYFAHAGLPISSTSAGEGAAVLDRLGIPLPLIPPGCSGNPADDLLDCIAGRGTRHVPVDHVTELGEASRSVVELTQACAEAKAAHAQAAALEGRAVPVYLTSRWEWTRANADGRGDGGTKEAAAGLDGHGGDGKRTALHAARDAARRARRLSTEVLDKVLVSAAIVSVLHGVTLGPLGSGSSGSSSHQNPQSRTQPGMSDRGASVWTQFLLCHERCLVQQYRQASWLALELAVCVMAGGMMGLAATAASELYQGVLIPPYTVISPAPQEMLLPSLGFYISMAAGLAGAPAAVRTFSEEKDMYQRESGAGHSLGAYFLAKNVASFYRLSLAALHFAATFTLMAKPTTPFGVMYVIALGEFAGVYGLSMVMSVLVTRSNSALLAVIASLVTASLCGYGPNLNQAEEWGIKALLDTAYSRWATELWVHSETLPYRDLFLVEEVSAPAFGYTLDRPGHDVSMLVAIALVQRLVAFAGLTVQVKLKL